MFNSVLFFGGSSFFLFLFSFLQGKTTYRHNGDSLRDLDTGTCKPGYLSFAQGEFFQVYS